MAATTAPAPTTADGVRLDPAALARLLQEIDALIAETAAVYTAFGEQAGLPGLPVAGVADVLGRADAADAGAGPGPEVAEAYLAFFTAWGQYLDELTGVLTELRDAVELTGATWAGADDAAAAAFGRMACGGFDFSGMTTLAAPDTAAGVGVGPECTAPAAGAEGRAGPPRAAPLGIAERWRQLQLIDPADTSGPAASLPRDASGAPTPRGVAGRGGV